MATTAGLIAHGEFIPLAPDVARALRELEDDWGSLHSPRRLAASALARSGGSAWDAARLLERQAEAGRERGEADAYVSRRIHIAEHLYAAGVTLADDGGDS